MFRFSLKQLFALALVILLLIAWWRAFEIPWAPGFGSIHMPHRVIQAEVIDEFPDRDLKIHNITYMSRSRLKDGILNITQAFRPMLTGLFCKAITDWVRRRAYKAKRLPNERLVSR